MKTYIEPMNGAYGFGTSKEEALNDALINKCKYDISADTSGAFLKRREELYPWQPTPYMLHFNEIGCLVYENGFITNTMSKKSVKVVETGISLFYYIAEILGFDISYSDIVVVAKEEFNNFFKNISKDFRLIEDMPIITISSRENDFLPEVVYRTNDGIIVGVSSTQVGLKLLGEEAYYVTDISNDKDVLPALCYIGYRRNILITEEDIKLHG